MLFTAFSERIGIWLLPPMLSLSACGSDPHGGAPSAQAKRGAPPPSAAAPGPSAVCAPGKLGDPLADRAFTATQGSLCLDTKNGLVVYGEGGKPIHGICDPFDGECDVYLAHGIDRLLQVRYAAQPHGSVEVNLSRFATSDQAYAMFTKRTVGDSDPAGEAAPTWLDAGGAAALGVGNAYLWRGQYLAELTYVDTTASEEATKAAGNELLPGLARAIGEALDGDKKAVPAAIALLPPDTRLPLGARYILNGAFGVKDSGPFAMGYHRTTDGHRFRSFVLVASDVSTASSVFAHITEGGKGQAGIGDEAKSVDKKEGNLTLAWVFARKANRIFGLGDESRVLSVGMPAEKARALNLDPEDRLARLKQVAQ